MKRVCCRKLRSCQEVAPEGKSKPKKGQKGNSKLGPLRAFESRASFLALSWGRMGREFRVQAPGLRKLSLGCQLSKPRF